MLIKRLTPVNKIEIKHPRYRDRVVLVATYKVKEHNSIIFTEANYLKGQEFYVSGSTARSCPVQDNGKISCYAVPMDKLESLERV